MVSCPSPQGGAELGPSRALSLCLAENGGGGSGTGEQCLKPNCVLSNPSAEDSSPSPSRLADKCRSRPPVCQGCLNWYQDVPGLHRPGHCLPPACLLLLQSLASLWLPTSIPGSTGPRGVGASRTSPSRALVGALPSPSRRQFNVPGPGRRWGDAEKCRQARMHFHGNNTEG